MIYKAVKYILENNAAFVAEIGTDDDSNIKVYPIFPAAKVAPPFVAVKVDDQMGNPTKDQPSQVDQCRLSVRIYAYDLAEADDIEGALRNALDLEKTGGTYDGVVLASVDFESFRDDFIERQGGPEVLLYRELFYDIWIEP